MFSAQPKPLSFWPKTCHAIDLQERPSLVNETHLAIDLEDWPINNERIWLKFKGGLLSIELLKIWDIYISTAAAYLYPHPCPWSMNIRRRSSSSNSLNAQPSIMYVLIYIQRFEKSIRTQAVNTSQCRKSEFTSQNSLHLFSLKPKSHYLFLLNYY
jgi:hypothetical protein